jgi:hypothetical protein
MDDGVSADVQRAGAQADGFKLVKPRAADRRGILAEMRESQFPGFAVCIDQHVAFTLLKHLLELNDQTGVNNRIARPEL